MLRSPSKPSIKLLTEKIVEACRPEQVILFGSHVWGRPGPDSDIDLLVIQRSHKSRRERELQLRKNLFPPPAPYDVLVYTPQELKQKVERERNLFLEDVLKNGTVLYDADKVRPRMARARR